MTNTTDLPALPERYTIQQLLAMYDECKGDWCAISRRVEEGVIARMSALAASAPSRAGRWPFVETPREFTDRLHMAYATLGGGSDLLAAVRHVLIEQPPTFATLPAQPEGRADLVPKPPNDTGSTTGIIRWEVQLPSGAWLGAWDKDAFGEYARLLKPEGRDTPQSIAGFPVVIDPSITAGAAELRQGDVTLGRIEGIGGDTPQAERKALTDDDIEAFAHRRAWKYKHSSDPNHSHTYTFNRVCLIDFVRDLGIGQPAAQGGGT